MEILSTCRTAGPGVSYKAKSISWPLYNKTIIRRGDPGWVEILSTCRTAGPGDLPEGVKGGSRLREILSTCRTAGPGCVV
ncbi:hypothetical protein [Methanocalculus sp.]|uniref:hypothetical protein n=1 Tax=Methanocalculus sp. TaxID=2004547 RepID=UPI00271C513F|nr:hypothetical protein [Methanocalculus sp.]MDO8840724.1 hypothetical protein [Methanocalculus sp.]